MVLLEEGKDDDAGDQLFLKSNIIHFFYSGCWFELA